MDRSETAREAGPSIYRTFVDVIHTGILVIVPLVIMLFVLSAAFGFVADALRPFIQVLQLAGLIESVKDLGLVEFLITVGVYETIVDFLTTIVALVTLFGLVVVAGLLVRVRYGERLIDYVDAVIGGILGVGSIYGSFQRMGDARLETSVDTFWEVVLVEFLLDDVYVLVFETAQTVVPIRPQRASRRCGRCFSPWCRITVWVASRSTSLPSVFARSTRALTGPSGSSSRAPSRPCSPAGDLPRPGRRRTHVDGRAGRGRKPDEHPGDEAE